MYYLHEEDDRRLRFNQLLIIFGPPSNTCWPYLIVLATFCHKLYLTTFFANNLQLTQLIIISIEI